MRWVRGKPRGPPTAQSEHGGWQQWQQRQWAVADLRSRPPGRHGCTWPAATSVAGSSSQPAPAPAPAAGCCRHVLFTWAASRLRGAVACSYRSLSPTGCLCICICGLKLRFRLIPPCQSAARSCVRLRPRSARAHASQGCVFHWSWVCTSCVRCKFRGERDEHLGPSGWCCGCRAESCLPCPPD